MADDPAVKLLLELEQSLTLLGRQLRNGDSGRARNHFCDVLGRDLGRSASAVHPVLELSGAVVVLGRGGLIALARESPEIVLEAARVVVLRACAQTDAGACLVEQVDRLVRQEAVADVAV